MLLIVDIDGTLADIVPRMNKAGTPPDRRDKHAFQNWLDVLQDEDDLINDPPISEVIALVHTMKRAGHQIVYLTGRAEKYRNTTQAWLKRYGLFGKLFMRSNEDWRSAHDYKEYMLKGILSEYAPDICLAIDDDYDDDVTHAYSRLGIQHLKVMARTGNMQDEIQKFTRKPSKSSL